MTLPAALRLVIALFALTGASGAMTGATITFVGKITDRTDFHAAPKLGTLGYWFAAFGRSKPELDLPTDSAEVNALPAWAGPLVHLDSVFSAKFPIRTFSQDGPCRARGGLPDFNVFTLPNGRTGRSGIILDPHAAGNTSNTVNRIRLGPGTPSSFYLRVVVDNTSGKHNAIGRIRARGNHAGRDIEPETYAIPGHDGFNGIADVYTFRFDGFVAGDFIKLQLAGMPNDKTRDADGASFAGLLFDPAT